MAQDGCPSSQLLRTISFHILAILNPILALLYILFFVSEQSPSFTRLDRAPSYVKSSKNGCLQAEICPLMLKTQCNVVKRWIRRKLMSFSWKSLTWHRLTLLQTVCVKTSVLLTGLKIESAKYFQISSPQHWLNRKCRSQHKKKWLVFKQS